MQEEEEEQSIEILKDLSALWILKYFCLEVLKLKFKKYNINIY